MSTRITKNKRKNDENKNDEVTKKKFLRRSSVSGPLGLTNANVESKDNAVWVRPAEDTKPAKATSKETKAQSTKPIPSKSTKLVAKTKTETKSKVSKVATKATKKSTSSEVEFTKLQQEHEELKNKFEDLIKKHEDLKNEQTELITEYAADTAKLRSLEKDYQQLNQEKIKMEEEFKISNDILQQEANLVPILKQENEELTLKLNTKVQLIDTLEESLTKAEDVRRQMHNTIQDLKGNIRVFCRVRPILSNEQDKIDKEASEFLLNDSNPSSSSSKLTKSSSGNSRKSLSMTSNNNRRESFSSNNNTANRRASFSSQSSSSFSNVPNQPPNPVSVNVISDAEQRRLNVSNQEFKFDRVFGPKENQNDVFNQMGDLIQSVLDGYNVCVFAYGQTGSGKTWTMEGNPNDPKEFGVIQNSMHKLFDVQTKMKLSGWTFENTASQLEIYNETIKDLLVQHKDASSNGSANKTYNKDAIKHDGNKTYITNLNEYNINKVSDVLDLLSIAQSSRSVASTKMNSQSSRSHSVFILKVKAIHEKSNMIREGKLVLIDLAGSERIESSGVKGEQLKEAQCINLSLSSLSTVIQALSKKQKHIPYRNSTLTYLLQNCLGGDSKVLMMVNVSPLNYHTTETVSSLRFAQTVNACEVGVAKKNGENSKK